MGNSRNYVAIQNGLSSIKELVYDLCGFESTNLTLENESQEYHACTFSINELNVLFRKAKITPTKTGQFVTLWKRIGSGPIQPFEDFDLIDLFVINVQKDNCFGQFVFPKEVLCDHGVVSTSSRKGKRAMRIYPPWDITTSIQARTTQKWQSKYFLKIEIDKSIDINRARTLYLQDSRI